MKIYLINGKCINNVKAISIRSELYLDCLLDDDTWQLVELKYVLRICR